MTHVHQFFIIIELKTFPNPKTNLYGQSSIRHRKWSEISLLMCSTKNDTRKIEFSIFFSEGSFGLHYSISYDSYGFTFHFEMDFSLFLERDMSGTPGCEFFGTHKLGFHDFHVP